MKVGEAGDYRQRVRIGLTGLAFVFLLVLIGAAITNWTADDAAIANDAANAVAAPPNDPLAEIGAAPGEKSAVSNATATNKQ
jgi:hypothetical protein